MKLFSKLLLLEFIVAHTLFCSEQHILIWDYDGTIVEQNFNSTATEKPILPNVASVMQTEKTINIVCSGIRALQPTVYASQKKRAYNPHDDIEKFKKLMVKLPIKAAVFSYALGGTECWVLIKTDDGFELRTAHQDERYRDYTGLFQKPDVGMLQVIHDLLTEWNIITTDLLFIGDTLQDQQAAEAYGIPFQHADIIHHRVI